MCITSETVSAHKNVKEDGHILVVGSGRERSKLEVWCVRACFLHICHLAAAAAAFAAPRSRNEHRALFFRYNRQVP